MSHDSFGHKHQRISANSIWQLKIKNYIHMKITTYILSFLLLNVLVLNAQTVQSNIAEISLFPHSAQITRETQVNLKKGKQTLVFKSLANNIQTNSIRVQSSVGKILSVKHTNNYMEHPQNSVKHKIYKDSLELVQNEIKKVKFQQDALKMELDLIKSNQNIKGNTNDISISLITDLPYEEIKQLTKPTLTQQNFTFKNGKKNVKITDIDVYGSNEKMIIKLNLMGSLKGEVFLSGVPKYDATNQTIYFDEMDYDIKTKNILAKSANWLAHDKFVKIMQPYFKYSIAKQLKDIKSSAQKTLNNYKISNGIFLNGKINDLNLNDIVLTQQTLKCIFKIKGNASVKIDDL